MHVLVSLTHRHIGNSQLPCNHPLLHSMERATAAICSKRTAGHSPASQSSPCHLHHLHLVAQTLLCFKFSPSNLPSVFLEKKNSVCLGKTLYLSGKIQWKLPVFSSANSSEVAIYPIPTNVSNVGTRKSPLPGPTPCQTLPCPIPVLDGARQGGLDPNASPILQACSCPALSCTCNRSFPSVQYFF